MAIELATAYVTLTADTKKLESGIKDALTGSTKFADTAGKSITQQLSAHGATAGRGFGTEFSKGLSKGVNEAIAGFSSQFGRASGPINSVLTGMTSKAGLAALGVAGIGVAAIGVTKELYDLGSRWDSIADGITGKTGLVGSELNKLTDSIKKVGSQSSASLSDIGDVAGSLAQAFRGIRGKELEDLTQRIADLNELTGDKLNVRDLGKVFRGFNIDAKDMGPTLDRLYDTFTNTGIPVSELIQTLKAIGPTARTMGIDVNAAAGLVVTLEEAGVDADTAMNGLKIGLGNLAKSGKEPQQAIQDIVGEIGNLITSGREMGEGGAVDIAKKTFGKGWQPIFDAIKNGKLTVDDLNRAVADTGHTIEKSKQATDDWAEEFKKLKNTLQVELEPVAAQVFGSINDFLRETKTLMDDISNHHWGDLWGDLFPGAGAGPLPTPAAGTPNAGGFAGPVASQRRGGAGTPATHLPLGRGGAGGSSGFNPQPGVGSLPTVPSMGPVGGAGGAAAPTARGYAHSVVMPYWESQGFVVGDHAADQYGEHQNGAVDVMVSGIAAGQPVVQQALSDPNVYGVIFNGQVYGYGHGMTPQPYGGPNPHTDHVHIWYKPQGYASGGGVGGSGSGDRIPILAEPGEHMLTRDDVAAMGGQSGVYAFRNSLQHMDTGGVVDPRLPFQTKKDYVKWASEYIQAGIFMLPPGLQSPDWQRDPAAIKAAIPGPRETALNPGENWAEFANAENVALQKITNPSKRGRGWMEGDVRDFLPRWTIPKQGPGLNPPEIPGVGRGRLTNPIREQLRAKRKWEKGEWQRRLPADILFGGVGASLGQPAWPHYQQGGAVDPELLQMMQDMGLIPQKGGAGIPIPPGPKGGGTGGPLGSMPHGGTGLLPGPKPPGTAEQQKPIEEQIQTSGRTEGLIPATAGSTGVAGTSFVSGLLNLGSEAVQGAIQTAADLGKMAASAAVSAGTFGAGAAAGPAAGMGIDVLTGMAKRGVQYGFQMAGIGADALIEQLFPFGAPRWLGYDYTGFMPHLNMTSLGVTTGEKAALAGAQAQGTPPPGEQPGGPVQPGLMSGQQQGLLQPSLGVFGGGKAPGPEPPPPPGGPAGAPAAAMAPGAAKPTVGPAPAPPPPTSPAPGQSNQDWLKGLFGFDQGGWMSPGQAGINLTRKPEPVLTPQQWEAVSKNVNLGSGAGGFGVHIENMYATDAEDAARQIESRRRLAMMQYSSRP